MLNVPYNTKFISRKIAKNLLKETTEKYMRRIIDLRDQPAYVQALEDRFVAEWYTYKDPMTNEQFKEMAKKVLWEEKSKDPLEVNNTATKLKTNYTSHYMEWYNKKEELKRIPEIVKQYENELEFMKSRKPTIIQRIIQKVK